MNSVVLRPATADDLDALLDVQQEAAVAGLGHIFRQDEYPFPRSIVRQRWAAELEDRSTNVYLFVEDTSMLIGFAATRANELLHFGTALHTWGTGVAQRLHEALLLELARTAPLDIPFLSLCVFEANLRARRFYERLGWRATERRTTSAFAPYAVLVEYRLPRPSLQSSSP
jgi:RimJ/RimL family protein N-acetyltransferase